MRISAYWKKDARMRKTAQNMRISAWNRIQKSAYCMRICRYPHMRKKRIYAEKLHVFIWKVNSSVPPDRINDFENVNCTNCEFSETDYILHLMYLWWLCRNPDIYLPTSSRQTCLLEVWFQFGLVAHRLCLCPLLGKYLFLHQPPLFILTHGFYLEINRISARIQYFRAHWVYTPRDPLKVNRNNTQSFSKASIPHSYLSRAWNSLSLEIFF